MTSLGDFITWLVQEILYIFTVMDNITILNTTLLRITVGFLICNAIVDLSIYTADSTIKGSKKERRKDNK